MQLMVKDAILEYLWGTVHTVDLPVEILSPLTGAVIHPHSIGLRAGTPSVAVGTILYPSLVDLAGACFETRAGT